jgi:IS30 family transposase
MGSDMRHCVLTLVERKTGYAIIKKLPARNKDPVTRAASRAIRRHCRQFKTLTLDNGTESHEYALLEQRFPVKIYFATPYHSWERGSNENFNGLLRQYLPKGTCMSKVTQTQCNHIADDLNHRPRKRFGFDTPAKLATRSDARRRVVIPNLSRLQRCCSESHAYRRAYGPGTCRRAMSMS